jgi:nucleoside-diphosphate-sugar epimerase
VTEKVADQQFWPNLLSSDSKILVFGCGYLGLQVAENVAFSGHRVWGTTRQPNKCRMLSQKGVQPVVADWTDARTLQRLPEVDKLLIAVSYDRHDRQSRFASQVGGLRNLLQAVSPNTHVVYISTTGVYHQSDGRWVDENSPTRPTREGGQVHLSAEELLHRMRPHSPSTILRLSGIYGPQRVPRAADVIAGRPIASPSEGFLNLIHVADAARAVAAAWSRAKYGLYVISDDQPVVRGAFYREIAKQCAAPLPVFCEPQPDASVRMRSDSNKRIWNRRMKRDLLPTLQFPTYREGLVNVLRA